MIVIDPDARRRDWKVGRIVRTYAWADGLVRLVDVKGRQNWRQDFEETYC